MCRPLILEIWANQKYEISSRRYLTKLKSGRIKSGGVSGERSGSQDCNGEEIILIRQRVRELSRKYWKWPKMESNPLVFFRFPTFFNFLKKWSDLVGRGVKLKGLILLIQICLPTPAPPPNPWDLSKTKIRNFIAAIFDKIEKRSYIFDDLFPLFLSK